MKDIDKGVLYAQMFVGTLGLMIVGLSLLHQFFETRSLGSSIALLGFPLVMIYLNYIESKAGVPKIDNFYAGNYNLLSFDDLLALPYYFSLWRDSLGILQIFEAICRSSTDHITWISRHYD